MTTVRERPTDVLGSSSTDADKTKIAKTDIERAWVGELRGAFGADCQCQAFEDLANYLFKVAWNYLLQRQGDIDILADFTSEFLSSMAQDFVQETLEKFARDDFAILDQYRGEARFTAWAARVLTNRISGELRKSEWKKRRTMPTINSVEKRGEANPELTAVREGIAKILFECLESLPPKHRRAFLGRVIEGETSKALAKELDMTVNAVDLLIFRCKPKLRKCLDVSGVDSSILEQFSDVTGPREQVEIIGAGR